MKLLSINPLALLDFNSTAQAMCVFKTSFRLARCLHNSFESYFSQDGVRIMALANPFIWWIKEVSTEQCLVKCLNSSVRRNQKQKFTFALIFSTLTQKVKKSIRCQKWQKFEKKESEKKIIGEKNESAGKFYFENKCWRRFRRKLSWLGSFTINMLGFPFIG